MFSWRVAMVSAFVGFAPAIHAQATCKDKAVKIVNASPPDWNG
jgi:hypothetical protein